jgi:rhamnogalacturonyl hydrolase YesR
LAGLVRVLQFLPADHPSRPRFLRQYGDMADKILRCQQPDGLWRSSLLDPADYPLKETSGSGFYCFALGWGINQRLLSRARFEPAALKAWRGLANCVTDQGRLTHVQPIGADPKKFDETSTEIYGVGAFLLAGSEVYRLSQNEPAPAAGQPPTRDATQ